MARVQLPEPVGYVMESCQLCCITISMVQLPDTHFCAMKCRHLILSLLEGLCKEALAFAILFTHTKGVVHPDRPFPATGSSQAMLLMEELFFMPFWGMPVMAGRSSGMTGVLFLCRLGS